MTDFDIMMLWGYVVIAGFKREPMSSVLPPQVQYEFNDAYALGAFARERGDTLDDVINRVSSIIVETMEMIAENVERH